MTETAIPYHTVWTESAIPGHYWITDRAPFNQFMPTKDYEDLQVLYIGQTIFHRLYIITSRDPIIPLFLPDEILSVSISFGELLK